MNFFKAKDQTEIFFKDMGDGAPVILIHGWPLNADMFEYQTLDLLRKGFRVIAYDRRGFGRSEQTASHYDYDTFADDLSSLIEHLGLKKVSLVGFSMGGGEIARYLGRHGGSKIASVALVSSVAPYMLKDATNPEGVEDKMLAQITSALEEDRPNFLADFLKNFFGANVISHPVSQETQNWCFNMAMNSSLKGTIDCVTAFGKTDFRKDMAAFTIPTLIIHGDADKVVPMATSGAAAAKLVPKATFKIYEGAPHGLFITHKQQLCKDLFEFLNANRGEVTARQVNPRSARMDTSPSATTRQ